MRKLLNLALVTALAFSLTACGGSGGSSASNNTLSGNNNAPASNNSTSTATVSQNENNAAPSQSQPSQSQPTQSQPSQTPPTTPRETPVQETPTQEVPVTEIPTETPTQEVVTETPGQEEVTAQPAEETGNAGHSHDGLTLDEYIDSIMAGLNMNGRATYLARESLNSMLNGIDKTCIHYNCPPSEIEAHKKDAVTNYFDGIAELIEEGNNTLDSPEGWSARRNGAVIISDAAHRGQ